MKYEDFQKYVMSILKRSRSGLLVKFKTDEEKGKHYANFSDGTLIVGNLSSLKLTVKWGSGHTAMATV